MCIRMCMEARGASVYKVESEQRKYPKLTSSLPMYVQTHSGSPVYDLHTCEHAFTDTHTQRKMDLSPVRQRILEYYTHICAYVYMFLSIPSACFHVYLHWLLYFEKE